MEWLRGRCQLAGGAGGSIDKIVFTHLFAELLSWCGPGAAWE